MISSLAFHYVEDFEGVIKNVYNLLNDKGVFVFSQDGFTIEKMIEPLPTDELLEKYPEYADLFHKPDFLLVKAKK